MQGLGSFGSHSEHECWSVSMAEVPKLPTDWQELTVSQQRPQVEIHQTHILYIFCGKAWGLTGWKWCAFSPRNLILTIGFMLCVVWELLARKDFCHETFCCNCIMRSYPLSVIQCIFTFQLSFDMWVQVVTLDVLPFVHDVQPWSLCKILTLVTFIMSKKVTGTGLKLMN